MFKEIFNPGWQESAIEETRETLENEDIQGFKAKWHKLDAKGRDGVARSVFIASDPKFAGSLFDFFEENFDQADILERQNIVTALGSLGARCFGIELKTSDYLMELIDKEKENRAEIVKSLQNKATCFLLPQLKGEQISQERESRIEAIVQKFLNLVKSENEQDGVKLTAINGMAAFANIGQLRPEIENGLKSVVQNKTLKNGAVNELVQIVPPGDPLVLEQIHSIAENFDFTNSNHLEKMRLAQNIGRVGTTDSLKYLTPFSQDPDQNVRADAKWAYQQIEKRSANN